MDKIAILILAHKNPHQLARLITCFNDCRYDIYIHIDKKVDISPFKEAITARNGGGECYLCEK